MSDRKKKIWNTVFTMPLVGIAVFWNFQALESVLSTPVNDRGWWGVMVFVFLLLSIAALSAYGIVLLLGGGDHYILIFLKKIDKGVLVLSSDRKTPLEYIEELRYYWRWDSFIKNNFFTQIESSHRFSRNVDLKELVGKIKNVKYYIDVKVKQSDLQNLVNFFGWACQWRDKASELIDDFHDNQIKRELESPNELKFKELKHLGFGILTYNELRTDLEELGLELNGSEFSITESWS